MQSLGEVPLQILTLFRVGWPPTPQVFCWFTKNAQTHCFLTSCLQCFTVLKSAVIYTFLGIKSVQNTGSSSVFNALTSQNP